MRFCLPHIPLRKFIVVFSGQSSLHRFGCTSDARAVPAANPAHSHAIAAGTTEQFQSTPEPRSRGPVGSCLSSLGASWRWVVRVNQRVEESWLGDVLALISLIISIVGGVMIVWAFS